MIHYCYFCGREIPKRRGRPRKDCGAPACVEERAKVEGPAKVGKLKKHGDAKT